MKYLIILLLVASCAKNSDRGSLAESKANNHDPTELSPEFGENKPNHSSSDKNLAIFFGDLEQGKWLQDFAKRCMIFKDEKTVVVDCQQGPCSKLEESYLISRYTRQKSNKIYKKQLKFDRCRYKNNIDIIEDKRNADERKYIRT